MKSSRTLVPAALAGIAAWFLYLARGAYPSYFNYDDMLNLHAAWVLPVWKLLVAHLAFWSGTVRPLGGLFYVTLFRIFGFNPEPFRTAVFAFLLLNIGLQYAVLERLLGRCELAVVATLFVAFQGACWDVYWSTGGIYDILAQTFVLVSVLLYVRRQQPSWWIIATTVLAIDAKEMGLVIPALLAAYDIVYRRRLRRFPYALASIPAVFLISRFAFHTGHTGHVAYTPALTVSRYLETSTAYIRYLLFERVAVSELGAVAALSVTLALALALRSREMVYGWAYYVIALLPMSFVTTRSNGYPLYIPLTGIGLYLVALSARTADTLARGLHESWVRTVLLAGFAWLIAFGQLKQSQSIHRRLHWAGPFQPQVRATAEQIPALVPRMRRGAHVLLVNDPYGDEPWQPLFVLRLRYLDPTLDVERMKWDRQAGPLDPPPDVDHTFVWDGRSYSEWTLSPKPTNGAPPSHSPAR